MKTKKEPIRKCVGCNEHSPKRELLRVVKSKDGVVSVDFIGKSNGRGAYICRKLECLKKAQKRNSLSRALETNIDADIYEKLEKEFIEKQDQFEKNNEGKEKRDE